MAQEADGKDVEAPEEEDDGYKVAQRVSVAEIMNKDKDDESLQKYKQALLGDVKDITIDANDKRQVFFDKFILLVEGQKPLELDPSKLSKDELAFSLVEGTKYSLKVVFRVQRDVVFGLKKQDIITRKGIKVDKSLEMMGAFKPSAKEIHEYKFPEQTTPSGMMTRGKYVAKTTFLDDDNNKHLAFEYGFQIVKADKN